MLLRDLPTRALSVRAPWDFAILEMGKPVENRKRSHRFRGLVFIHTSSWWKESEVAEDRDFAEEVARRTLPDRWPADRHLPLSDLTPRLGRITGMVEVADCVAVSDSPWFFGPVGFTLRNPVIFKNPVQCKGALGFFPVPESIRAAVAQAEGFANA
ncbi:hypothetical protein ABMY26_00490 (plasmid) [Azospirillum sp. HJ39]|uniref:hypothetical protein n=1 Tax=Azospirillum sp. HJ39 TaxID=3159496 RepID=UPI0035576F19